MDMERGVRVRFAPSPTGPLHIGGLRTALYNYLYAKKHNGTFILRIEDTDQARFVPEAEAYILESLRWCGILPDEGQSVGGEYGPYRQSERKSLYRKYADKLVETGFAYFAFDTADELEAMRNRLMEAKSSSMQYDAITRCTMRNSLTLSKQETQKLLDEGAPYVIRFKMPENETVEMNDLIRGSINVNTSTLDDKVLFKSDGMPTYHLANIVDDHLMEISHVIRGEEWLPSLPLHILLYRALGWVATMPAFAHLPLLLKPDGNGKLSKRDGDRLGFPVFPLRWPMDPEKEEIASGYRESGYFHDAVVNMLALLGWNPGTEQEIFSLDELIAAFTLERVGKSGSKFDPEKARWFNHYYLVNRSNDEIAALFHNALRVRGINVNHEKLLRITGLVKERVNFIGELWAQSNFFFEAPVEYDEKVVKKRWKEEVPELMVTLIEILQDLDPFTAETSEQAVKTWISEKALNMGLVMNAFRLCIVGAAHGPHLFDIIDVIGKQETIERIERGIRRIKP